MRIRPTPGALAAVLVSIALSITVACGDGEPEAMDAGAELEPTDAGVDAGPPTDAGPPPRLFAKRFVAKVHSRPDRESDLLGYLRAGAVLQARNATPLPPTERCREGWYELTTGGFVCSGRDVIAFQGRRMPARRPAQPNFDAPLPYEYGRTRREGAPLYRRLPSDEEAAEFEGYRIPGVEVEAPPEAAGEEGTSEDGAPAPVVESDVLPASGAAATAAAEGELVDAGPLVATLASLEGDRDSVLDRRLMSGFIVSLDRDLRTGRRRYWRTLSNGIVPYLQVGLVHGSEFHGEVLDRIVASALDAGVDAGTDAGIDAGARRGRGRDAGAAIAIPDVLPLGYVTSSKTTMFSRAHGGPPRRGRAPGYHHMFHVTSEEDVHGTHYVIASDAEMYRDDEVTVIRAATTRPEGVGESETWIDVDLAHQSLVAYEGLLPVYATLVSSGRIRDPEDPLQTHDTPTGLWRIRSKYVTHTMDGDHATDGPYSIEDVPYVMYFELAFALHSAFWHDGFGRPRSHGCVNLAPADARWLFDWSHPRLPEHWHTIFPSDADPATWIYVHGTTPEG
jgi:hypothetical protein